MLRDGRLYVQDITREQVDELRAAAEAASRASSRTPAATRFSSS